MSRALRSAEGLWRRARSARKPAVLHIEAPELYSMDDALQRLGACSAACPIGARCRASCRAGLQHGLVGRSAVAATFAASLELARAGKLAAAPGQPLRPHLFAQPARRHHEPLTDPPTIARKRCGSSRRCSLPSAAPLDEASLGERLPEGTDVAGAYRRARSALPRRAASISCASRAAGRCAPRPIWRRV